MGDARTFQEGDHIEHFRVTGFVDSGGYGEVYEVMDERNGARYAMKIERRKQDKCTMITEEKIFEILQDEPEYFPELVWTGKNSCVRYIIMEYLGVSLSKIRKQLPDVKFSMKSAIKAGIYMLRCIEALHKIGIIHRDVSPQNFLLHRRENTQLPFCLIDFGLSRFYLNRDTREHMPPRECISTVGNLRYCSVNALRESDLSRRDDLISWFFTIVELAMGSLPWTNGDDKPKLLELRDHPLRSFVQTFPAEMSTIGDVLDDLGFTEAPNYSHLYDLLEAALLSLGDDGQGSYDWEPVEDETDNSSVVEETQEPIEEQEEITGNCCQVM